MSLHPYIHQPQRAIRDRLAAFFAEHVSGVLTFDRWGSDVRDRLAAYAANGKLIRGALVGTGYLVCSEDPHLPDAVVEAGVAMELLQSFLLIHDDIMDQDELRRGATAIHAQYAAEAPTSTERRAHYGASMGICVGDVAAVLAFERIATLDLPGDLRARLVSLVSREIALVGLAQMQDVHNGYLPTAGEESVRMVYTYKTGRYTFSLPLMLGAIIAEASHEQLDTLSRVGERLGFVFQVRDDWIGLFGDSQTTGKPVGSDIREDKKTLYRELLFARIPQRDPVRACFGAEDVSSVDVEHVRGVMEREGVVAEVDAVVAAETARLETTIRSGPFTEEGRDALLTLLHYNRKRAA